MWTAMGGGSAWDTIGNDYLKCIVVTFALTGHEGRRPSGSARENKMCPGVIK